jgi:hypothetical protein
MTEQENVNHLPDLYGQDYAAQVQKAVNELAKESNIPFDTKYVQLGISFLVIKANELYDKKPAKMPTLTNLITESFGEAAMYKYNIAGGVL